MKKLKLLLVLPNYRWVEGDASTLWQIIPYNLCLLAAMVRDVCEVSILDAYIADMTQDEVREAIAQRAPDVLGVTVMMDQFAPSGHAVAAMTKDVLPETVVLMGGVYMTVNPQIAMRDTNIDYGCIGEGEYVMRALMQHFTDGSPLPEKGIIYRKGDSMVDTGRSDFIEDLSALPFPAYDLIDYPAYANSADRHSVDSPRLFPYGRIFSSRGCPVNCVFCQVKSIQGSKFRPREAEDVLNEIAWLKETYGIRSLTFDDDNFFTSRKRAKAILEGMIERDLVMPWVSIATAVFRLDEEMIKLMRRSGCQYICIAIESGTRRVVREIVGKPIDFDHAKNITRLAQKEGIFVSANFIIGFPTETWEEIRETIRFAEEMDPDYMKLFHAIPLRNTRLWELCEEHGLFKKGFDQGELRWSAGQIETDEFMSNDLTVLRAYEWDRINFGRTDKRERIASQMRVSMEELDEIRKKTRANAHRQIALQLARESRQ